MTKDAFADDPRYLYQDYASKMLTVDPDGIIDYDEAISDNAPIIQRGWTAEDGPIGSEEIDDLMDDEPLFPWG